MKTKIEYIGKCLLIEENRRKILVVGDLHLGYEEILNKTGVFVSRKIFEEIIKELDEVFLKIGQIDEVILLGDVKDDFGSIMKQEWKQVGDLVEYLGKKSERVIVVKGNHDKIIEPLLKNKGVELKDYYVFEDFCFLHGDRDFPEIYDKNIKYWIIGHGHPAVKLSDNTKVEKFKCYLEGDYKKKKIIIVPSFFEGNLGSDPRENDLGFVWKFNLDKFNVKIIGKNLEVLDFGKLGKL